MSQVLDPDLRRALGAEASRLQSPTSRTLRLELSGAAVDVLAYEAAIARGAGNMFRTASIRPSFIPMPQRVSGSGRNSEFPQRRS